MMGCVAILFLTLLIAGCTGETNSLVTDKIEAETEAKVVALINKLAISDKPAANSPVFAPDPDTPRTDKRIIAYNAASDLKKFGKKAFPLLLVHLEDNRQSVAFRRSIPHDVGLACFCIIEDQILNLPSDYRGSFYRKGKDGKSHPRPCFLEPGPFTSANVNQYLSKRKHMSLEEMQIEALQWLIKKEEAIGFQNEKDKSMFLEPLKRQVQKVKKKLK